MLHERTERGLSGIRPPARSIEQVGAELVRRRNQQNAITELGRASLSGVDTQLLLGQVCLLIQHTLTIDYCEFEQQTPDGWRPLAGDVLALSCVDHDSGLSEPREGHPISAEPANEHLRLAHGVERVIISPVEPLGALVIGFPTLRKLYDDEIEFIGAITTIVGELVTSRRVQRRFRAIIENSADAIALLDSDMRVTWVGPSTERVFGWREAEMVGRSIYDLIHPNDRAGTAEVAERIRGSKSDVVRGELRLQHRNGSWMWIEACAQNLLDDAEVGAVVVNYRDVSERKGLEKELVHRAYYDTLTGLPNRALFLDRAEQVLAATRRHNRHAAFMFLDLDRFKVVNDTLGHTAGDELIRMAGGRIASTIRASDTVCRVGGDEFIVLVDDSSGEHGALRIANEILAAFRDPFSVHGVELYITPSIGVSIYPVDGEDVETLLRRADSAMYRAKDSGRNAVQLYTTTMNVTYAQRLSLELQMRRGIESGEFSIYLQPLMRLWDGKIAGYEALARWCHPKRGFVSPAEFIPVAEESRLIHQLGGRLMKEAMGYAGRVHAASGGRVGINISALQFQQPGFGKTFTSMLDESGIPGEAVEIEITETAMMRNIDLTRSVLTMARDRGVRVAVDDFGTGHSSLLYLRQLPIDTIKIDQTFVRGVTHNESDSAIVHSIIEMAHALKLEVVAEGVEDAHQLAALRDLGCDYVQGYLIGAPAAAETYLADPTATPPSAIRHPLSDGGA
jgi:diguanylate cyclase (GGDEF)-like protein/PAS domain S-box-containing protein